MEGISKDQELTLLRWATYVGGRPSERIKAFLRAEKGLSGEQIDCWWNNARARVDQGGKFGKDLRAAWLVQPVTESGRSGDTDFSCPSGPLMNAHSFDAALKENVLDTSFVVSQPTSQWHRLESLEDDSSSPLAPNTYLQHSRHSSQNGPRSNYTLSVGSSVADTSSLLSVPLRDSGYISQSVRSSGFSNSASSQAEHLSSSSLFDFNDGAWDNSMHLLAHSDQVINEPLWHTSDDPFKGILPEHLAFRSTIAPLSISKNISEFSAPDLSKPPSSQQEQPKKQHRRQRSLQSNASRTTRASGKFACTACQESFTSKYDWARHEGTQCEPQKHWICMLGDDPTIALEAGDWGCAFCNATSPDRDGMIDHLIHKHDINKCIRKPIPERTKTREDKFKDHLRKVHRLADGSTHWQQWHRAATPHEKHAWGCGFCGDVSYTWEDRLKHVAEHYDSQHLDVSQWSISRVIRGLLAQNRPGFAMAEAWKRLVGASGDQKLEWPKEHAELLKHKLECHEGTVAELVLEARRLAVPSHESRKMAVSGLEKPLPEPPRTSRAALVPSPSYSRLVPQTDAEMQDIRYM